VSEEGVTVRRVDDPRDSALPELSSLLHATFADPDTVLELDRMQAFLAQPERSSDRRFCVLVAVEGGVVLGGTVFSYVPATNCGFSEYLLARKDRHRQGIGRLLFVARQTTLDQLAREAGQSACSGLFIEADNPQRTPLDLQARERETAMDALERLQVFAHLGFLRVDIDYAQPPLGPEKQQVGYLDLLFAPWQERIRDQGRLPAEWVTETLCPIWTSWAPATALRACEALRRHLAESSVALLPLPS
jgi:GNAT superfamily N-acetyltransferase